MPDLAVSPPPASRPRPRTNVRRSGRARWEGAARHARDLVEQYEQTIAGINGRAFQEGRCPASGFFAQFTGMANVLGSLSACAVTLPGESGYGRVEDWNPIAQRPVARVGPPASGRRRPSFTQELDDLRQIYDHVLTLMHEAMHVVMWEPFFTGRALPTRKNWASACNAFEGFCFFLADIWIAGQIQAEYPDGQVIFRNRAASQSDFSPLTVFESLGVRDPAEILETYLDALAGNESVLWTPTSKTPFARQLAARLYPIGVTGARANEKVFTHFEDTEITASFYDRFCSIRGLPSLPTRVTLDLDDPHRYCREMFARGLTSIHSASPAEVARVRTRRMLQSRAYYAHQVQWLLEEGLVFCPQTWPRASRALDESARWRADIAVYLDELERILGRLAGGEDVEEVERELLRADRRYDLGVRRHLKNADLWVSKRELIFPAVPMAAVDLDRLERRATKESTGQLYAFITRVISAKCDPAQQLALNAAFFSGGGRATHRERTAQGAKLLTLAPIREVWSVPLAAIDPLHNGFRELLFNYE